MRLIRAFSVMFMCLSCSMTSLRSLLALAHDPRRYIAKLLPVAVGIVANVEPGLQLEKVWIDWAPLVAPALGVQVELDNAPDQIDGWLVLAHGARLRGASSLRMKAS